MSKNEVLLFSGGMDCLIAWYYLKKPMAVYFDIGHKYAKKEMDVVAKLNQMEPELKAEFQHSLFDLSKFEHADAHIPFRNRLLVMGAAIAYPEVKKIYLVAQKGEQSIPDRSPEFFKDMSELISKEMERKVAVVNPFPHMTKSTMVKWYLKSVGKVDLLKATVGCFDETISPNHCGNCGSCFRRSIAFEANGIPLDEMKNDITKWSEIPTYIKKMKAGKYEAERTEQTLKVLQKWGYKV